MNISLVDLKAGEVASVTSISQRRKSGAYRRLSREGDAG